MESEQESQKNPSLYLEPELLTANEANEKARPAEKTEDRKARVEQMARSIGLNGQEYPVKIVEIEDAESQVVTYEYVDGGCRVEAIALLNETPGALPPMKVWCTVIPPGEDLFKHAVTSNLHRTQNSILDMALIIQETKERNGWSGRGVDNKVAQYLGILPSRVSEFSKLLRAPAAVRERIASGEITALDTALKLMSVPESEQEEVATRAKEIAEKEQSDGRERVGDDDVPAGPDRGAGKSKKKVKAKSSKPAKPAKVKAKHITKAAREKSPKSVLPRAKSEILDFFFGCTVAPYPPKMQAFSLYLINDWAKGRGTDKHLTHLLDQALGVKRAKTTTKVAKTTKTKKPKAVVVSSSSPTSTRAKAKAKRSAA